MSPPGARDKWQVASSDMARNTHNPIRNIVENLRLEPNPQKPMIALSIGEFHSFIQVVCLTTGTKPLPKRALHIVRARASSFKWEYPLLSLRLSSSFLRLLPRLPVTYIPPFIFPSITRCRRQFLRRMWPIQFAFRLRISCKIFLCSLNLSNTSSFLTWSVQLIFSILLQHHISKFSRYFWSTARSVQVSAPYKAMLQT